MNIFFDGLDIRTEAFDFLNGSNKKIFSIPREKPFLNSSRHCLPYPFFPFINFVYYPKKLIEENSIELIYAFKVFPLNKIPWIADVEEFHYLNAFYSFFHKNDFFSGKMHFLAKNIIKKGISNSYCKKIVPWSEYSKKTIVFFGGKKLEEKTTVCYPAVNPSERKRKEKEKISLLFVATNPVYKGTEFVFPAFRELRKKFDVELNCFGNFSEKTKKMFPEINFGFASAKDFSEKILPENDILLMPSLMESFGFTALQAFSSSIPVVSSDVMALPEINQDNKTGFLIRFPDWYHKKLFLNPYSFFSESKKLDKTKIVSKLTEKTSLLIEDSSLRKTFGRNALNETEKGKFSMKQRKKSMDEIIEDTASSSHKNFH
ncbi:MAG: glycosyltransferase family 4 protein [archaeon]